MFGLTTVFSFAGIALGLLTFGLTLITSSGAPQQAAGAAIALCFVIIPYCLNGLVWRSQMLKDRSRDS